MKKPYRQADGFYHVDGKKYKTLFGSREQVMNGTVHKTTGGLTKEDLVMNKWGRIVSAKKFKTAKKEMRLQKHGFFAKKGKFGAVSRKLRGGKVDGVDVDGVDGVAPAVPVPAAPAPVAEVPAPEVPAAAPGQAAAPAAPEAPAPAPAPAPGQAPAPAPIVGGKSKKQNKSKKRR